MRFLDALRKSGENSFRIPVIPDIKCFSPKEGDLMQNRNPVEIAKALERAGAPVISVVTEEKEFHGSAELLQSICGAVNIPVLRKDFLRSPEDLKQTKELGADAALLMYSCLESEKLSALYHEAKRLGLDVLVETHSEEQMAHARALGAKLIGVNNRDITVLERDDGTVCRTVELAARKPDGTFLVSESALSSTDDVRLAVRSGADAVLVGTAILKAGDPAAFYRQLCSKAELKLCGMMDEAGISLCGSSGAKILGFVVDYPEPVPWNLTAEKAERLLPHVSRDVKTCVVTGGDVEKVTALAARLRPDIIQLHHRETLSQTKEIAARLQDMGIETIRTIPIKRADRAFQFGTEDTLEIIQQIETTKVSSVLVDTRGPSNAVSSEKSPPLGEFREIAALSRLPVILAGGITPDNVRNVLMQSGASQIDIMSGIETAPGVKSPELVRRLMEQIGG